MKRLLLLLWTATLASASVVVCWDYKPEYLESGPFEDTLQVSQDLTNWTNVPGPYQTVTNHPIAGPGKSYWVPLKDHGFTNGIYFFRAERWWTDTNLHPRLTPP